MSKPSIEDAWREFHAANPHVYNRLVILSRQLVRRGHKRIGIGMLFEVLRWEHAMTTTGDAFKLNNNYRALYAREIMRREGDLDGVFATRELRAGEPMPRGTLW